MNFSIVIPTYRRIDSLAALLDDLRQQTLLPGQVVVVDGDPQTGEVKNRLRGNVWNSTYLPSNHANAPYQRWLGALACKETTWIIFIDDDIRLEQAGFLEKLLTPFTWKEHAVVGISPKIIFPKRARQAIRISNKKPPGGLTPSGDRIAPIEDADYVRVEWLRGGVMAYQREVLLQEIFAPDAFAMSEKGYGLGVDDTFLSRAVGSHGELWLALCAQAQHPDSQPSQVLPAQARQRGLAAAYSRRFLNDRYRYPKPARLSDRLYLLKTYSGNFLLNWWRALKSRKAAQVQYAAGYSRGVLKGIFNPPKADRLCAQIDWQKDAKAALSQQEVIQGG